MIKEEIKIPIYRGTLVMILADNLIGLNAEYNLDFSNTTGGGVFSITDADGYTKYFVAFDNDWDNSIIVHESVHLVNDIFKSKRIELDPKNDEPQAYFTAWIFEQCEEFLKKHTNEKEEDRDCSVSN